MRRLPVVGLAMVALCVATGIASAQGPVYRPPADQDLQQPRRAPFTITPSLTVTEEFNDNIFLDDNRNRQSDSITSFSPGVLLEAESPVYRLGASYYFTADVYADHSQLSHAFDRHNLALDALYRVDPRTTLTLTDTFLLDTNTNLVSTSSVATGRYSGYFSIYDYPVGNLPHFDLTEKRDIYTPGGLDCPSIFDRLREAGVPYECYTYHAHTDPEILALAPRRAAESDARVIFLHLSGLDHYLHSTSTTPPA